MIASLLEKGDEQVILKRSVQPTMILAMKGFVFDPLACRPSIKQLVLT